MLLISFIYTHTLFLIFKRGEGEVQRVDGEKRRRNTGVRGRNRQ